MLEIIFARVEKYLMTRYPDGSFQRLPYPAIYDGEAGTLLATFVTKKFTLLISSTDTFDDLDLRFYCSVDSNRCTGYSWDTSTGEYTNYSIEGKPYSFVESVIKGICLLHHADNAVDFVLTC